MSVEGILKQFVSISQGKFPQKGMIIKMVLGLARRDFRISFMTACST